MYVLNLDMYQSAALGAVALIIGLLLVKKSATLRKYCIPAAVVGGIVIALTNLALHSADLAEIQMDDTIRNVFMMSFFCSVGFMASVRMLKTGGRMLLILLLSITVLIIIQDTVGPAMASFFGLDPRLGLCIGSISLVGGHGTSAGFGDYMVNTLGIADATTVAMASATFGLAVSSFIGGPLARRLVRKYDLKPSEEDIELKIEETPKEPICESKMLKGLVVMVICVGLGTYVVEGLVSIGVTVPIYLGAMIMAIIARNLCDYIGYELPIREITALGSVCLSMFIAMALTSLKLWQLVDLAAPMIVTLLIQMVIVGLFAYFVVFNVTGRNYDSAAYTTAVCGFGLGATPNAIANMEALFKEFGEAPMAYFIVPLAGSVFIDIINSGLITAFLGFY